MDSERGVELGNSKPEHPLPKPEELQAMGRPGEKGNQELEHLGLLPWGSSNHHCLPKDCHHPNWVNHSVHDGVSGFISMQMSWIRGSHGFVPGKMVFSFQSRQRGVEELAPPFERLVFLQLLPFSVSQFRSGLALECPSCSATKMGVQKT